MQKPAMAARRVFCASLLTIKINVILKQLPNSGTEKTLSERD
jgi:hypothetical protein